VATRNTNAGGSELRRAYQARHSWAVSGRSRFVWQSAHERPKCRAPWPRGGSRWTWRRCRPVLCGEKEWRGRKELLLLREWVSGGGAVTTRLLWVGRCRRIAVFQTPRPMRSGQGPCPLQQCGSLDVESNCGQPAPGSIHPSDAPEPQLLTDSTACPHTVPPTPRPISDLLLLSRERDGCKRLSYHRGPRGACRPAKTTHFTRAPNDARQPAVRCALTVLMPP
jgi:hypothetical protein